MSNAFAPMGLLFAGVLLSASGQVTSASASASATVIAPVNLPTSLADLPVAVSTFGGWIRVIIPLAQLPFPMSIASSQDGSAGASAAASRCLDIPLNTLECWRQLTADNGTVQGDIVSTLWLHPLKAGVASGGRLRVTVAFN